MPYVAIVCAGKLRRGLLDTDKRRWTQIERKIGGQTFLLWPPIIIFVVCANLCLEFLHSYPVPSQLNFRQYLEALAFLQL
jgi:hypothetical protein